MSFFGRIPGLQMTGLQMTVSPKTGDCMVGMLCGRLVLLFMPYIHPIQVRSIRNKPTGGNIPNVWMFVMLFIDIRTFVSVWVQAMPAILSVMIR